MAARVYKGKPITFRGETLTRAEWARRIGISPGALTERLKRGESLETALSYGPRTAGGRHAEHGGTGTPLHDAWKQVDRCEAWQDFERFRADVGLQPTLEHVIRRVDYARGLDCGSCDDCRARGASRNAAWAHVSELSPVALKGRGRITFRGTTDTPSGWAKRLGISRTSMSERFRLARVPGSGWTIERALTEPPSRREESET